MTAMNTATTPRSRGLNMTLWVLQVLLAVFFGFAGINKFFGLQQEMVDNFEKMGTGLWFRYFVGALEFAGAIGLVLPRFTSLAALELAGVMVGAIFTHLFVLPPAALALVPAVLGTVFGVIAWGRWPQRGTLGGGTEQR